MAHRWPGNVRELENLIRYLLVVVDGPAITRGDLPRHIRQEATHPVASGAGGTTNPSEQFVPLPNAPGDLTPTEVFGDLSWEQMEVAYARYLLQKFHWNVTRAAAAAGLNRSTFASRVRRLGLTRGN